MAITITVDNDRNTAGTQGIFADETAGVQTAQTLDDGNEIDVTLTAGVLGGFDAAFNTFLNSLNLSAAREEFARDHDGASSTANFVLVTTTAGETINDLFFSDASGAALNGDVVAGMTTLDGEAVKLYTDGTFGSSGDFCVAATASGDIVAAFYLKEAGDHKSAQVQMVTFEPLQHNLNGLDPDDALNFTDVLRVSASGTLSFDFDELQSGSSLWAAVGSSSGGVLVTGINPDIDNTTGKKTNASDVIHTSQGGLDATIGVNNQLFDNAGEAAVFTLVTGFAHLSGADDGATGDYVIDDPTSKPVQDAIDYSGYLSNVTGAGFLISQSQGSPDVPKSMDINVYRTNNATPEEGFGYVYSDPVTKTGDALADDIPVAVATVTIKDEETGQVIGTWSISPTGSQLANGSTQSGVTVTIGGNDSNPNNDHNIDVDGVFGLYSVSWTVVSGQTMNRFTLVSEAGQFDVGRVDVNQAIPGGSAVGDKLFVDDDGPTISGTITGAPTLTVDETDLATNASGNFAPQFTSNLGTDGGAATPVSYALSTPGGNSGLVDVATGQNVVLSLNANGQIEGRTATSDELCFVVSVNASGSVSLDQIRAVVHPTADPDESKTLASAGLVVMTATATDGDNDQAVASINIGQQLIFKDDGPSITATIVGAPSPTVDETNLAVNDSDSFAAQFSPVYGADGQGATPVTYALSTPGGNSGLSVTGTGNAVFLFLENGKIVGREGTSALDAANGDIVFEVSVDASGNVSLDQKIAIVHSPDSGPDQSTTLASAGLVVLTATANDKDGDSASAPLNIGTQLIFKDDAPAITAQIQSGAVDFVLNDSVTNSLNGSIGADVNSATQTTASGGKQYVITSFSEPTNVFPNLDGVLSADGTKVTYYSTNVAADQNASTAVYELSLNQTANGGAGSYTFTVLQPPPQQVLEFDFTDLPSGQNLHGTIANDKTNVNNNGTPNDTSDDFLPDGGLLVFPSNPDINDLEQGESDDGQLTNESGTVNTSKGGGPVTIGNANQAFDSSDEGAFFCYVDNPLVSSTGGLGLTQTSADDADLFGFDGTIETRKASVEIVQASGSQTVRRPGPELQITAYDIDPGKVGGLNPDIAARDFLLDPTATDAQANIISVKIIDTLTGNVIEHRTNLDAGASNGGALVGSDSLVTIQFVLDDPGGAGTADDIYSVKVGNLKANYTIEFETEADHDMALVQHVSGSYDIGGFNVLQGQDTPDQAFNFSVAIRDYDGDMDGGALDPFANFGVTVDGTGAFNDPSVGLTSTTLKTAGFVDDSGMAPEWASLDTQQDLLLM